MTSDNRYTDESGQMVYEMGPVSETTYPIPQITVDRLPHNAIQTSVYQPIYRPFELPNPYLQNPPLSPSGISFSTTGSFPMKGCKLTWFLTKLFITIPSISLNILPITICILIFIITSSKFETNKNPSSSFACIVLCNHIVYGPAVNPYNTLHSPQSYYGSNYHYNKYPHYHHSLIKYYYQDYVTSQVNEYVLLHGAYVYNFLLVLLLLWLLFQLKLYLHWDLIRSGFFGHL